jgi:hypothetical protein
VRRLAVAPNKCGGASPWRGGRRSRFRVASEGRRPVILEACHCSGLVGKDRIFGRISAE